MNRPPDADRPWQYSLRTLLLMPLVLWLLMMACFPKLMTGDFCNVRIEKLSVHEDGAGGTELLNADLQRDGRHATDSCRAVAAAAVMGLVFRCMAPRWQWQHGAFARLERSPMTAQKVRNRLLVEQGKTYRVVPGKPLYFYDFKGRTA